MITGNAKYPGILKLPSLLQESGAFEVVHAEGRTSAQGVVLLKRTGRAPRDIPALVDENTVTELEGCERSNRGGYSSWLRAKFPNGIRETHDPD
jgi:hypothetical protein